jgi:hypothetical protein
MRKTLFLIFVVSNLAVQRANCQDDVSTIQQQVWNLTEVMYHDVVNPPAAARFYAYTLLAGYETLVQVDSSVYDVGSRLHQYKKAPLPSINRNINKELAVLYAILEAGKQVIPSGYLLAEKQQALLQAFEKKGVPGESIQATVIFAQSIAKHVASYSRTDGYFKLSTLARYKPSNNDSCWRPTPPEYMAAVEPHWRTIRTFFLDATQQFNPVSPICFDKTPGSDFMKMTREVYETGRQLSEEQKLIANFWDCNPFAVQFQGHMSIGLKKISPGGHWMGITGIASRQAQLDFNETMLIHVIAALTLHDAFSSCWTEKYRSNRVRPETVINRYIDDRWKPLLQTPPFPEYSSGHSVISTAVATVLTQFLGDGFEFTDTIETYIGLPSRRFTSFNAAAAEARISRLYGGIHFRDAIENGGVQGRQIGEFILKKLGLGRMGD